MGIKAECDPATDFPAQLQSALRFALKRFSTEPAIVYWINLHEVNDQRRAQRRWLSRASEMLRLAARSRPGFEAPPLYLEPLLIEEVCQRIIASLRSAPAEQLPSLLPELFEAVLSFYFDPEQVQFLVGARGQ